jgi:hypothetical protein
MWHIGPCVQPGPAKVVRGSVISHLCDAGRWNPEHNIFALLPRDLLVENGESELCACPALFRPGNILDRALVVFTTRQTEGRLQNANRGHRQQGYD